MDPLTAGPIDGAISTALTGVLDPTVIAAVAAAGLGLGVVTFGFRRMWGFFKSIAK